VAPRRTHSSALLGALVLGGALLAAPASTTAQPPATVRFAWPLAIPLSDPRVRITNYPDHDSSPSTRDYTGGTYTYDGHAGTDININSFRAMDEGVPVVAAANGIVLSVQDGNYDREFTAPNLPGNYVYLAHEDGTTSLYYHLRTNSATVRAGEYVREGQMLGFVGSSGFTLAPHLHFEVTGFLSPHSIGLRDPFEGPSNPYPGLWKSQQDYVGDDHLLVHELGVTTGTAFSDAGSLTDWLGFKEGPSQPMVLGADEPGLRAWVLVTGLTSDVYAIEILRPDGSVFSHTDFHVTALTRSWGQSWQYVDVPFAGHVTQAEYGEWTAQVVSEGIVVRTDPFTVGESSLYAPRFSPVAGRSFHLTHNRQEDVLTLSFLGAELPEVTFALENAPGNVSLRTDGDGQTIVVIDPAIPGPLSVRSREFAVVATDPRGYQGRMHYHLVDDGASTLGSPPEVTAPEFISGFPNDTIRVDVSAVDADGDALTDLRADLSRLPAGHGATFTAAPDHRSGRLTWPTRASDGGDYLVLFTAETSFGGVPVYGYPPIVQDGIAPTRIHLEKALAARAFTTGGDRTLRLVSGKPSWCASLEPVGGDFTIPDLDMESIELVSTGTGTVERIRSVPARRSLAADQDANSIPDVALCFAKEDLRALLSSIRGRRDVPATIEGTVRTGEKFSAPVILDVVGGGNEATRVFPNPLNPEAVLTIESTRPGPLRVDIYDPQGRRIRTLFETANAAAGTLELRVDARDDRGGKLGSGVYFYRVTRPAGTTTGRFVILK
jgi:hypothetical protein